MGVEAFFYAYDEDWFSGHHPQAATIDALLQAGIIAQDGSVVPAYAGRIRQVESLIGANKQWNNNLAADFVYSRIRKELTDDVRARADAVFDLLFWDAGDAIVERPAAIAPPIYDHASSCRLYRAATVAWLADPPLDPEELRAGFAPVMAGWPAEERAALGLRNLDDAGTFIWWIECWRDLFTAAAAGDSPRALLIYIWY